MLLVDSDYLIWRACSPKRDFIQCIEAVDWYLYQLFRETGIYSYRLFLSTRSFRHQVDPGYKAARTQAKPRYFKEVRQWLLDEWGAEQVDGLEADDLCGIYQDDDTVIVSEDKDTLQIPGNHYRISRTKQNYFLYVTEEESWRSFYVQMLTGDLSDSVEGLKNPAKAHHKNPPNFTIPVATQLLSGKTKEEMEKLVQKLYKKQYGKQWQQRYDQNYKLLYILRDFPS